MTKLQIEDIFKAIGGDKKWQEMISGRSGTKNKYLGLTKMTTAMSRFIRKEEKWLKKLNYQR